MWTVYWPDHSKTANEHEARAILSIARCMCTPRRFEQGRAWVGTPFNGDCLNPQRTSEHKVVSELHSPAVLVVNLFTGEEQGNKAGVGLSVVSFAVWILHHGRS